MQAGLQNLLYAPGKNGLYSSEFFSDAEKMASCKNPRKNSRNFWTFVQDSRLPVTKSSSKKMKC